MNDTEIKCVREISSKFGIEEDSVVDNLDCKDISIQSCDYINHCSTYGDSCISRSFPDVDIINRDPDKYIIEKKLSLKELENFVKLASHLYYNYGGGGLTDNSFDALEYHLNKRLRLKGRQYEKIGAEPVERIRIKLPYGMPSLSKLYPDEKEMIKYLHSSKSGGIRWSEKLDGVSAMIIYKKGKPDKIYTRGDGTIGGDVSHLTKYLTLPILKEDLVIRGELLISKEKWEESYKDSYLNSRYFVSAKVNQGFISDSFYDMDFLAYEIIGDSSNHFKTLKKLGFKTPVNGKFASNVRIFEVMNTYKDKRSRSEYMIDGLVLELIGIPQSKKAFKMKLEEQKRETKVMDIEWRITRYGRYFPVAKYESVYIDGTRLHKASAHNASHIRKWNMGKGTKITIIKAGDVIPAIVSVEIDKSVKPIFPCNSVERSGPTKIKECYPYHWSGSDLVLDDIEGNKEVQIKRVLHFFETLSVPGFGEKTAEKLWENGFTTVEKVVSSKVSDFIKLQGFGKVKSQKIYKDIHSTMRKSRIDRYIVASTTMKVGIGRTLVKELVRYFPDVLEKSEREITTFFQKNKIPGFGPKRIENISKNIPLFREFLYSLNREDIEYAIEYNKKLTEELKEKGYNPRIKDKTFVMTGFLLKMDYELEDYIYDHFGNIGNIVNKNTEAVISGNIMDITTKMEKAKELNVPVYTVEEFKEVYNLPN